PEIADILRNKCKYPVLCFDIDNAGQTASGRAARETGFISIRLPEDLKENNGKDIADFFMQKRSKDELDRIVQETTQNAEIPAKDDRLCVEDKSKKLSQLEKVEATILENFKLRFNVVSNEIEFRAKDGSEKTYKTLNENNIYRFLLHNNINISMAKLTALLRSNFVAEYNPFNSYFTDLPSWNAKIAPDSIGDLCAYLPVKDGGRFRTQFKKALVRTIACALSDTVINKQALILVHEEQNSGKSTFIRWLCPPDLNGYIAENISTDKDSQLAVCDNLIINMDELATLSKAEINSLKSIFSKELVKVRRPYAKTATTAPRRASFFGSTNKAEFLTDETGSVRWLCFELTGKINWDYKKDFNIDDIWRQAYHLYLTGFKYELTAEEIIENGVANLQFQVNTTELELIQKHFQPGNIEKNDGFYTASDFSNSLIDRYEKIRLNLNNIGKALKLLGFQRVSKRHEKYPIKGYYFQSIINQNEVTTLPH
ncbi:MAG: hypothetical protein FJY07_11065, partial [Bacteroidetes bacterium]|nr:hypothetical protein [Bacteroidota bacterium]